MSKCTLCPRHCMVERTAQTGYCRAPMSIKIARAALHMWEEPCISGNGGSGTIFFSGCNLGCVFCQNKDISKRGKGEQITTKRLQEICFELKEQGAENINLVTPMHYAPALRDALLPIKSALSIPIVCNTGGYDLPETIALLDGVVDCYLPDFKFADSRIAADYANAPDYPDVAKKALHRMIESVGKPVLDARGMMQSGVLVRHLILPGSRKDSIRVLDILHEEFGSENILLSLMSQYTPQPDATGNLARKLTDFEYRSVLEHAEKLGFCGFMQDRTSANSSYTPPFDLSGVHKSL